jgi:hypothetical protein
MGQNFYEKGSSNCGHTKQLTQKTAEMTNASLKQNIFTNQAHPSEMKMHCLPGHQCKTFDLIFL